MKKLAVIGFSLFLALGSFYGCKKQEKAPSEGKTQSEMVNQTIKEEPQTKEASQESQKPTKTPLKTEKVIQESKKIEDSTQRVAQKTEEASGKLSCLKCHGDLTKLSEKILPLGFSSGAELANYLKNRSPKRAYHKNLSDSDITKAFESIPRTSKPSKKIEGC